MAELRMPSLGADMEEGTLLEWLVQPGATVHKGDVVAVVDTAKAAVEIECFTAGVVDRLLVEPGTTVAVGTPLALIGAELPAAPQQAPEAPAVPAPRPAKATTTKVRSPLVRHQAVSAGVDLTSVHGSGPGGTVRREDVVHARTERPRVTPYARRLSAECGVDLTGLEGSGAHGAVRARDVRAAAAEPGPSAAAQAGPPAATPVTRTRSGADNDQRMREAIARLMSRSKREIPHYYLRTTIDLAAATAWLHEHNRSVPVGERLLPAALLLAATARAATEVPEVNGYWVEDRLEQSDTVHLGVAVSLRSGGMVTPAVHDAQTLTPVELMVHLRDLVVRARAGRLRASELTDATLTVTNLGDQGVEEVLGVIYPPQVALVGFGTVLQRPWAVDGLLGVRPLVVATLSADHRATDGYVGARFLGRIDRLLQQPEEL